MKTFIYQFVITFFLLINKLTETLRWDNSNEAVLNESRILLGSTKTGPKIDVYQRNEVVIVKNIATYNYPITIYCIATGYRTDSQLSFAFCSKKLDCKKVVKLERIIGTSMEITGETLSKRKGLKLRITLKSNGDSSDEIYCEVADNKNFLYIRSASIQIRDVFYWKQNLIVNENNLKTTHSKIDNNNLPITFSCFTRPLTFNENQPKWISLENLNPISWNVCPIKPDFNSLPNVDRMTFKLCRKYSLQRMPKNIDEKLKPKEVNEMTSWKYFIDRSGNLTIFSFDASTLSYAIMCYKIRNSKIFPINTYVTQYDEDDIKEGIKFDNSQSESKVTLSAISPIYQSVRIAARTVSPSSEEILPVQIFVKYYSSSSVIWKWFFNGIEINDFFIVLDKYSVKFKRDITKKMEGNYTLALKDAEDRLNLTVDLKIVGSPSLISKDCMPLTYYVWVKENVLFSCNYQFGPNKIKFKINQQDIQKNYSKGVALFSKEQYPHLNNLRFEISSMPLMESPVVNAFYKAYSLNKFQDHTIMISMENEYGLNVISTSIYVLPTIESQIERFPHKYNCLGYCSSNDEHNFFCRFKKDDFLNKDLQIHHYWIINNEELDLSLKSSNILKPYVTIDSKTQDLTLNPIYSNDSKRDEKVKEFLKDYSFECRIKIVSNADQKIIYDSRFDEKLKKNFFSKITLDNKTTYIISGICIGAFVLLFGLIVIMLVYRKYTNRGKTYKIEKMDIQFGINPENEFDDLRIKEYQPWSEYADRMFLSCTDMNDDDPDDKSDDPDNKSDDGHISGSVLRENVYEEMNTNTF